MSKLVVGLGNPGPEYEWTRHNVGFHVVERIAALQGVLFQPASALADHAGLRSFSWAHARDAWLVKPEAFMNRSGAVVAQVAAAVGCAPEEILVVYDDFDLPLGKLRIRTHGGPGTHNGMRSIVTALATERFPRLRVGIGAAGTDAARHVLETFTRAERVLIDVSVAEAADAVIDWLASGDLQGCMTRFHSRWNQGREGG